MDANGQLIRWLRAEFLPYQLRWITEPRLSALALKGRQLGFTDASAAGCILGGLRDRRPQIVLSAAEDNAIELLDATRRHCTFLARAGLPAAADFAVNNTEEVRWKTGGGVKALAANARTARSFHGDLWLDEFAFHQDPEAIWSAAAPMASRGGWRVRVFSTANGAQGLFYDWCSSLPAGWAFHRVSLDDAESDGLRVDRRRLLELVGGDERVFAEAYLCSFLDATLQYLPTEMVDAALRWAGAMPSLEDCEIHAGLDVGRTSDLTALTILAVVDEVAYHLETRTMSRTAFAEQKRTLASARDRYGWDTLTVDATGLGTQLAEELAEEWGDEVRPVTFTAPVKERLYTRLFRWMHPRRLRLQRGPEGEAVRAEMLALQRRVTRSAQVVYEVPRTGGGHGDRLTSLALALDGAGDPPHRARMGDRPILQVA